MTHIKLLSFNIHKGFGYFNRKYVLPELRDAIREAGADIVFLQEVLGEHSRWAEQHRDRWPYVTQYEYLADSIWDEYAYGRNAVYPQGHHGNAILSKYPLKEWENFDISLNGIERRGVLYARIDLTDTGKHLHLFCTHLSLREPHRQWQIQKIISIIHQKVKEDEAPVILAGDFNDWRKKSHHICRENNFKEVCEDYLGRLAKSFPAFWPMLRLDRIYIRDIHDVISASASKDLVWSKLSDHRPIAACVKV